MSEKDIGTNTRRMMKLKGLTIPKLAALMKMGTATVSNILNGKSEPKSSTLIKISHALNVNLAELLADPPELKSLRYRTNKVITAREKAEKDQILYLTSQWLENYHFLEKELNAGRDYQFAELSENEPAELAGEIRKIFSLEPTQPVYDLPGKIVKAGIKLYLHPFGFKKTFGLSVSANDLGPAIVVNTEKDISIERRIFTIAHELGHLLMHKNSYNSERDAKEDNQQEKEADSFAGLLLLPDKALKEEWENESGLHWVNRVLKIKKMYQLSYQTVLRRLDQVYPQYDHTELRIKFAIDYRKLYKHDLKYHYEPEPLDKFMLVEARFDKLVQQAFTQGIISFNKAKEMLCLNRTEMLELIASWKEMEIHD